MTGVPASRAATRAIRPAFEQWVCTTVKFSRRISAISSRQAIRSCHGEIRSRMCLISTVRTPAALACSHSGPPGIAATHVS